MTTDLWMLVWSAVLCLALTMPYLTARLTTRGGLAWGLGNRDREFDGFPAWAGRAERAHRNLVENLAPFAILVLVAHVAGKANAATALGATIFFWGRVVHAFVYLAGIVYLRTLVFAVALIGELMILLQLFR
jgi:uncharacterized MAPEG superfamily protein